MKELKQNISYQYQLKDEFTRKDYKANFVINSKEYSLFRQKCEEEGFTPSDFLREQIKTFLKTRLSISERDNFYTIDIESEI